LILKALIEGFETPNLLQDLRGDVGGGALGEAHYRLRKQPQEPLLLKAAGELPDRFRMTAGGVCALPNRLWRGGALLKEDEGPDEFVAPLDLIHEAQLPAFCAMKEGSHWG
jgi:hypothetical protein